MYDQTDTLTQIRQHLTEKSADELIGLLMDLVRQMDETTRRRFWEQLAPSGLATADLRYPAPEAFLAEVEAFVNAAAAGEYYDDEAAEYFGEDPVDRRYHIERGYIDEYDIADHDGASRLRELLEAAAWYDEAGRFDVVADAYERLLGLLLPDRSYDLFGVDNLLLELGFRDEELVERFFVALCQASAADPERSASRAVTFLGPRSDSWQDLAHQLVKVSQREDAGKFVAALRQHLEGDTKELDAKELDASPAPEGAWPVAPFVLRLLIRLGRALRDLEETVDLCARFRLHYPDLYMPLLEDCAMQEDWEGLLRYGAQALALPPRPREYRYAYRDQLPNLDLDVVRDRMAVAQEQLGDLPAAFAHRSAVFEHSADFEDYVIALQVAQRIGIEAGQAYTARVLARLRPNPGLRPLLCQVYLYDGDYDSAFEVVQDLSGYGALDELKLVAKAHVLAALHGQPVEGEYLPKVKSDLDSRIINEYARFLRDYLPMPDLDAAQRADYVHRGERLYVAILETHIAAGSKRYDTAAYYCALLAEIAVHMGYVETFEAWYGDLLRHHKRKRSLPRVLGAKVQPVLRRAAQG